MSENIETLKKLAIGDKPPLVKNTQEGEGLNLSNGEDNTSVDKNETNITNSNGTDLNIPATS